MPDFSTDKITQLEKENRKVRRQLKNVNEKYKSLKLKKIKLKQIVTKKKPYLHIIKRLNKII
ncbi:hypothetical protein CKN82_09500 [Carnobacterium divergens]|uniref:hypothetical protein n=1 Tax=Carnobacterium divergens TaxID=2748 RepID=UPI0011036524|nr:hypothetical protein CKN70_09550 [Carnobacterium divergens]TFI79943.1 hypothetical protein CKN68_09510 [Carnobacterium divergens]TFI87014.1 hypothetical protein CKN72_09380 [Carnobacterium divergens]TFI88697.1 hypothetical protein CKN61_09785 [Carnobacterium divergens]TFI96600.1 hypothetical protein CKN67_09515 [Carnobacterium divergens]